MKASPQRHAAFRQAFSLVELLVVIAVIAIIATIAIPNIANITGAAGEAAARRNAQSIASVYSVARAAGVDFGEASFPEILTALQAGVTGGSKFEAAVFRVDGISEDQLENSLEYLQYTQSTRLLVYVPDGVSSSPDPEPSDPS